MAFGDAYRPEEGNKMCLQQHGLTLHSGGILILAANNCKKNGELDLACVICMVIFQTLSFFKKNILHCGYILDNNCKKTV
jgi:hypothetical protein